MYKNLQKVSESFQKLTKNDENIIKYEKFHGLFNEFLCLELNYFTVSAFWVQNCFKKLEMMENISSRQ